MGLIGRNRAIEAQRRCFGSAKELAKVDFFVQESAPILYRLENRNMRCPLAKSALFTLTLLTLSSYCLAALDEKVGKKFVPPELQATDPEIRQLVEPVQQATG